MAADADRFVGLIVRLQPLREADLIVSALTERGDLVDAFARGARKSSRRFRGALELFALGELEVKKGRSQLPSLASFDLVTHLAPSSMSYEHLCVASSVLELASRCAQPNQLDPSLFRWAQTALMLCDQADISRLRWAMLVIDLTLLKTLGVLPDVSRCGRCGQTTLQGASWPQADEEFVCSRCQPKAHFDGQTMQVLITVLAEPEQGLRLVMGSRAGNPLRERVDDVFHGLWRQPLKSRVPLAALTSSR